MLLYDISPRFCETDAMGHINNTVLPMWFEAARGAIFELFNPGQDLSKWNLILRKIDVDYLAQTSYEHPAQVRTRIGHVGSSSFVVEHELWQEGELTVRGSAVMIFYDYGAQQKRTIPPEIRAELQKLG
ncbi:MAG: thioesterase family protein [Zhongshania sp.]|uniref:Acyl-CoA thioesterase n=1 Tax=Zhongshania guokunii TaxID=641783 RepID=A0ABV3U7S1_9GAMM|nr:thioesterase family protein [Zhongshania sp.]MDF1691930.1 thioesterase family protein [Zhongshania sp.]